jgi:hypothetical protein
MRNRLICSLLVIACGASISHAEDSPAVSPLELFEQRITPILRSPEPASCVQCHLSSVDLKDYIRPSHDQTFVSLRDQGLIDMESPDQSKILTLISMGEKDKDVGAKLIHEKTRRAEYEAFSAWIHACCNDPRMRDLPPLSTTDKVGPAVPDEVIRHGRKSRLVDSFVRNIWSQRMRCFPCHTPHELDPDNPKHATAIKRHKKFMEQHGKRFGKRLTIFHKTPEETMQYLIERSLNTPKSELPLLNLEDPKNSLLVLKPTAKLPKKNDAGEFETPSYVMPVSHMGGLKMHDDDQSYKSFLAWINDYANVTHGRYTSVSDLPADNWYASKHVIMMRKAPEAWPDASRVQFFVHAWNQTEDDWDKNPVAFTQVPMGPARNAAGALFVFGPSGASQNSKDASPDPESARLQPGRYLIKAYVDRNHRLNDDPMLMLGSDEFAGQTIIEAKWGEGFKAAEKLFGRMLE